MACAWNTCAGFGEAAIPPENRAVHAAVHNRSGAGLTDRVFAAYPGGGASPRPKLSTQPVDKRVDEGVGGAFHAPVFVGFRKHGEIMTMRTTNQINGLRVKRVRAHQVLP